MNTRIILVDAKNDRRWDEFVDKHPQGTVYHSSAWAQVLESSYGYTPYYLAIVKEDGRELDGIVPMFFIGHRLTGKRLVSLPFTAYCKMLIRETEFESIVDFARKYILKNIFLEFKLFNGNDVKSNIFEKSSNYVIHLLQIDSNLKNTFRKFHITSIRQKIKRAEQSSIAFRLGNSEKDLKEFYRLFIDIRKKHGLPPHPYKFFLNMWTILKPKNLMILPLVEHEGKVLSAGIIIKSKNTYHFEYSASDQDNIKLFPNHKLIWDSIQMAHQEGIQYFDFGRSSITNKSLIDFKERWGADRYELPYFYYPKGYKPGMDESSGLEIIRRINMMLPDFLLRIEGNILYRFIK